MRKYKPLNVVWETTLKCNMKCMHCGSSAGIKRKKELTTEEAIKLCDNLDVLGAKIITLMGGEPFLRKDWEEIAKYIKSKKMQVTLITNGYLINDDIISKLTDIDPHTVGISLDGGTPETHDGIRGITGSFDKCLKEIENLRNNNINTSVITTVHKKNFKELPLILKLILDKGLAWQIQMATPIGRFPKREMLTLDQFYSVSLFISATRKKYSPKQLLILGAHNFGYYSKILPNLMILPWTGCQAGLTTLGIQSDGGIKGCMSLPDNYVEGNIRQNNIIDYWKDPLSFSYNRNFTKQDLKGECINCKHGKRCKGGCLTVSESLTKEKHADPYCLKLIENTSIIK